MRGAKQCPGDSYRGLVLTWDQQEPYSRRLRRRGSLFEEGEQRLRVSGSVADAQDLHAPFGNAVIDNIAACGEGTEACFEFRAAAADFRMFGEEFEDFDHPNDEIPGRLRIASRRAR